MSQSNSHSDWLNQIDVTGPFLAIPVLTRKFPTGLPPVDPQIRQKIRFAYDEWVNECEAKDRDLAVIHRSWIELVLNGLLDYESDILRSADVIDEKMKLIVPEYGFTLRPDYVLVNDQDNDSPFLLIQQYAPGTSLDKLVEGENWKVTPEERMVRLCRATQIRLGLVTNGERWMLVDALEGGITSFASWYARYWIPEPLTLQAFHGMLGVSRFFGPKEDNLTTMIDESLGHQDEVTEALGKQVTRAIEVFVQKLDKIDQDRNRELLSGTDPSVLYEAGLTVMMRLVFLLCAEERGLLLLDDEKFDAYYAVSSLREHLATEPDFILEKRSDAWSRLLAIFRAVYGGIEHETLRMPALGGSLFDPDRFPFLEGRANGSNWHFDLAEPLEIDNRTTLLLLESIQLYEGRTLSYQALDVEQIGYVYEGLLERTVEKTKEITIELDATQSSKQPWVTLLELESAKMDGHETLQKLLKERLACAATRVANDLKKAVDDNAKTALLYACDNDTELCGRLLPFAHFIKNDGRSEPLVYPKGSFRVALGSDRRDTGTHYTPKSLTEAIVKETLEPVVYVGPAEGAERSSWQLKASTELLDLKICDMAMGSGAFLVQVVRYLTDRLLEAWDAAEVDGDSITIHGVAVVELGDKEPMSRDPVERETSAKRLVAERCIYGVDLNPLAVELAKLSIWLVTMAKDRPFGFLDHNLKSGDSLLGIHKLPQLYYLEMQPGKGSNEKLFAGSIRAKVNEAMELRKELRRRPILDIHDVKAMARLDEQSQRLLEVPHVIANGLIGEIIDSDGLTPSVDALAVRAGEAIDGMTDAIVAIRKKSEVSLNVDLPPGSLDRRPFHWPLEFPEVFSRDNGGFDAIVGNPPFLGSQRLSSTLGEAYKDFLVEHCTLDVKASADLVAHFFIKTHFLRRDRGSAGLVGRRTLTEGKNRNTSIQQLLSSGEVIYCAMTDIVWPGKASVVVHTVCLYKGTWSGPFVLDGELAKEINAGLEDAADLNPSKLRENLGIAYQGTILGGEGFKISEEHALGLIEKSPKYEDVLFPFIGGGEVNKDPFMNPQCWVINFWDWEEGRCKEYERTYEYVLKVVKSDRQKKKNGKFVYGKHLRERWWEYLRMRPDLYYSVGRGDSLNTLRSNLARLPNEPLGSVIVISTGVTKYPAFLLLPNKFVFSNKLCVIADASYSMLAILNSDIHTIWAWANKTSMGADLSSLVYAHGNIFETFPFPVGYLYDPESFRDLDKVGQQFNKQRRSYMEKNNLGLTKYYNKFHDPKAEDAALNDLRQLQSKLNNLVLDAYGITDICVDCGFRDVKYLPSGKNTRFTISEKSRRKLIITLAALNVERTKEASIDRLPTVEATVTLAQVAEPTAQYDIFDEKEN